MERVCREADGLFPAPPEIKMSCSCPDWADMCKHVAATLYGVGTRLNSNPDLLFTLRGVDRTELVSTVGADLPLTEAAAASERVLADDDVAALFGIEMAASLPSPTEHSVEKKRQARRKTAASAPIPPKALAPKATKSGPVRAEAPGARLTSNRAAKTTAAVVAPAKAPTKATKSDAPRGAARSAPVVKPRAAARRP